MLVGYERRSEEEDLTVEPEDAAQCVFGLLLLFQIQIFVPTRGEKFKRNL